MIPKDAIVLLKGIQKNLEETDFLGKCAIDMAIEALKEQRPHGKWIDKGEYAECSICGGCSGTQFDGVEPIPLKTDFCPNCGASMSANDRQVTGKLNSEIEKSKSKICPCIECCALDISEHCRKGCLDYQKWKEGESE